MNQISNQISDWYLDISLLWIRYLGIKEISRYQDTPTAAWCLWAQSLPCLYLSCVYSLSCLYTWVRRCCETFNGALRLGSHTVSSDCQLTGAVDIHMHISMYISRARCLSAKLSWKPEMRHPLLSMSPSVSCQVTCFVTSLPLRSAFELKVWERERPESLSGAASLRVALAESLPALRCSAFELKGKSQSDWLQDMCVGCHVYCMCGMPCVLQDMCVGCHDWLQDMCVGCHV